MKRFLQTGLFLLGTAAAVGYYMGAAGMPSPFAKGKKNSKNQSLLGGFDLDGLSQRIFGQSSTEMQRQLTMVLRNFKAKLLEAQRGVGNLSDVDYDRVVNDFTKKLEDDKSFTKTQIKKISDYLRTDFGLLRPTAEEV